ncbi:sodium/potassium-transporting ATPase subunit beta-like [Limulus polyphemus]|uniref:Sodium/potassium-transporting ATPase subunit beta-like n=1 Tax=Limulus polyphemus TaxID=6850 RepID=A0ABM1C0P2_LIMPO|nr:sodium/potassium-transporting ATPase subunit beta-like [Limulus polyphemus]
MAEQETYQLAYMREDLERVADSSRDPKNDDGKLKTMFCCRCRRHQPKPPRDPTHRILTFTGMVCLICTFIVITVVLVAVLLSQLTEEDKPLIGTSDIISIVPKPQDFIDRKQTILVHRHNSAFWKRQVAQLKQLLKKYEEIYTNSTTCQGVEDLKNCPSLVDLISPNCSEKNNFAYDIGSPCVALVFKEFPELVPEPLSNTSGIPDVLPSVYDPRLLYLTCESKHLTSDQPILFSPFQGFQLNAFHSNLESPPMVMLQFVNPPIRRDIRVICRLWAKNMKKNKREVIPSKIQFSLLII